jgi:transcriptional regulator with XRE-family HTH domain
MTRRHDPGRLASMIKRQRKAKGIRRIDLARATKLTPAYITQLETGQRKNPSLPVLRRLARALDVPLAALLE